MIRVISSFADGPVNFHSTGPPEDQIQKLISSTDFILEKVNLECTKRAFSYKGAKIFNNS